MNLGLVDTAKAFTPVKIKQFLGFVQHEKLRGTSKLFRFSKSLIRQSASKSKEKADEVPPPPLLLSQSVLSTSFGASSREDCGSSDADEVHLDHLVDLIKNSESTKQDSGSNDFTFPYDVLECPDVFESISSPRKLQRKSVINTLKSPTKVGYDSHSAMQTARRVVTLALANPEMFLANLFEAVPIHGQPNDISTFSE